MMKEVEITPEMIQAGKDRLEHLENASEEMLVREIYASMERARRAGGSAHDNT